MCEICRHMREEIQKFPLRVQDQLHALPMHSSKVNQALVSLHQDGDKRQWHSSDGNEALRSLDEHEDKEELWSKLPATAEVPEVQRTAPERIGKSNEWRRIQRLFK